MRQSRVKRQSPNAATWRKLDKLCRRLVVELRDRNMCQRCGKRAIDGHRLEWCHVHNRQAKSIQWTPWNSLALCGPRMNKTSCHFWFDEGAVAEARKWWSERWPERALALAAWQSRNTHGVDLKMQQLWLEQAIEKWESR